MTTQTLSTEDKNHNFHLIATCPEETKEILIKEITQLGASEIIPLYKAVSFSVDEYNFYKAHLVLATCSNLFLVLKKFKLGINQQGTLAGISKKIPWTQIFGKDMSYRVDGSTEDRGRDSMTSTQISKKVREGIEDNFMKNLGILPNVELKEPKVLVIAHLHKGVISISINTSGKSLHKRGYRSTSTHLAPLKETLAASILHLAGYDGSTPFLDPMCGSGTIAIEAGFMALNKACNIHRKKDEFGFEFLSTFNRPLWRKVQDDVRNVKKDQPDFPLYASDISSKYIHEAKAAALKGRVEKFIDFNTSSFFDTPKPQETGILVCNLPYGERLAPTEASLEEFYGKIGDHLKKQFTGWKACLLVSEGSPWKSIGLKPSRKIPLLNGSIKSKLLIFDIYAGSRES